ncbi:lipocalin family protein [Vibrio ostreicida]
MKTISTIIMLFFLSGCLGMPENIAPVNDFQLNKYLGRWYEVARLDHSFEKGLSNVTAEYRLNQDGGISVINRGYSETKNQWKEASGKAYFVRQPDQGYLKVSFFGPFYGSYVIFGIEEENYDYSFVSGPNNDYLWLLSRTPSVDDSVIDAFITLSQQYDFNTEALIFVDQNMNLQ